MSLTNNQLQVVSSFLVGITDKDMQCAEDLLSLSSGPEEPPNVMDDNYRRADARGIHTHFDDPDTPPSLHDFMETLPDIPQDKGDILWWERASDKGIPYIQLRSKHNIANDGSHMRMGFYKKGSHIELYAWGVIKSEMEDRIGFVNVLNSLNEPWIQNTSKGARGKIGGVRGYGIIVDDLTPDQIMSEINKFLK